MGFYRQRSFGLFDETKPLIAGRAMTLLDHELQGGDPIPAEVDANIRRRLWMTEWAHYKEDYTPTPELATHGEGREWMDEADGVTVEAGENGWYIIRAAWLDEEGERVRGAEAAQVRAAEIRETGDTKGVEYTHTGGGWYAVTAPWLDEPIKVQGLDAAKEKAAELRASAEATTGQPPAELQTPPGEPGTRTDPETPASTSTETGAGQAGEGGEGSTSEE